MSNFYSISSIPFYDNIEQTYKHIYIIDRNPNDPSLSKIIRQIMTPSLSSFLPNSNLCVYSILNPNDVSQYLQLGQEPALFSYLMQNSYTINTQLTDIIHNNARQNNISNVNSQLLCLISK